MGTDSRRLLCSSPAPGSRSRDGRAWSDTADSGLRAGGKCGPGARARQSPTPLAADASEARSLLPAPRGGPAGRDLVIDEVAAVSLSGTSLLQPWLRGGRPLDLLW